MRCVGGRAPRVQRAEVEVDVELSVVVCRATHVDVRPGCATWMCDALSSLWGAGDARAWSRRGRLRREAMEPVNHPGASETGLCLW